MTRTLVQSSFSSHPGSYDSVERVNSSRSRSFRATALPHCAHAGIVDVIDTTGHGHTCR